MNESFSLLSLDSVGFVIASGLLIGAAIRVVMARNLVHSVLWLGLTLAMTAVVFLLLRAPFLAGVQLLLYTGGVITLMLFGVMLTQRKHTSLVVNESAGHAKGGIVALATFLVLGAAIMGTEGLPTVGRGALPPAVIGKAFLTTHLFAFEVLSVLLLVVMIGAIVIARRKDFGTDAGTIVQAPRSARPPGAASRAASEKSSSQPQEASA